MTATFFSRIGCYERSARQIDFTQRTRRPNANASICATVSVFATRSCDVVIGSNQRGLSPGTIVYVRWNELRGFGVRPLYSRLYWSRPMISSQVPPLIFKLSNKRRVAQLARRLLRSSIYVAAALAIASWLYALFWISWKIVAWLLSQPD
jgi:hypothetical protein